jgi:hypothetical protein
MELLSVVKFRAPLAKTFRLSFAWVNTSLLSYSVSWFINETLSIVSVTPRRKRNDKVSKNTIFQNDPEGSFRGLFGYIMSIFTLWARGSPQKNINQDI